MKQNFIEPEHIDKARRAWNQSTTEQREQFLTEHDAPNPPMSYYSSKKYSQLPNNIKEIIFTNYKPLLF